MNKEEIENKITELYRTILCREPDERGLKYYSQKLMDKEITFKEIKYLFFNSSEYLTLQSNKFLQYAPQFTTSLSDNDVQKMFDSIPGWYHDIQIGNAKTVDTRTSLNYQMWISQSIPLNLNGMKILDVGSNDGFYSFLCESRGAKRIVAIDDEKYDVIHKNTNNLKRFQILKKILNSKVDYRKMNVYDLSQLDESFDIALLFGVYYHLENPVLAFQQIFPKINDSLFVSGHIIESKEPILYFAEPNGWWFASPECLLRIGKRIGFKKSELIDTLDLDFRINSLNNTKINSKYPLTKIGLFKFSK